MENEDSQGGARSANRHTEDPSQGSPPTFLLTEAGKSPDSRRRVSRKNLSLDLRTRNKEIFTPDKS